MINIVLQEKLAHIYNDPPSTPLSVRLTKVVLSLSQVSAADFADETCGLVLSFPVSYNKLKQETDNQYSRLIGLRSCWLIYIPASSFLLYIDIGSST